MTIPLGIPVIAGAQMVVWCINKRKTACVSVYHARSSNRIVGNEDAPTPVIGAIEARWAGYICQYAHRRSSTEATEVEGDEVPSLQPRPRVFSAATSRSTDFRTATSVGDCFFSAAPESGNKSKSVSKNLCSSHPRSPCVAACGGINGSAGGVAGPFWSALLHGIGYLQAADPASGMGVKPDHLGIALRDSSADAVKLS